MGLVGYLVQSKIARDQISSQRSQDPQLAEEEKQKERAQILLDRMTVQQAECARLCDSTGSP
jgi:hypothetical protein